MHFLENRLPPPIVMAFIASSMAWLQWQQIGTAPLWQWWLGALFFVVGAVVVALALRAFAQHQTTVNPLAPERATSLVTGGIFARSRNPMYLAMLLWLCAVAMVGGIGWQWLGPLGFILFINRFQIIPEERAMDLLFGVDYKAYKATVSRWLGWRLKTVPAQA